MTVLTHIERISLADAGLLALLGYAAVFAGLILLMLVVMLLGKLFAAKKPVEAPAPQKAPAPPAPAASGTAGQLKLHDVPPKTAAVLMAIVADKMGKPLNELRFISIKEVK